MACGEASLVGRLPFAQDRSVIELEPRGLLRNVDIERRAGKSRRYRQREEAEGIHRRVKQAL